MTRAARVAVLVLLAGCARPPRDDFEREPSDGACYAAFGDAVDAWEAKVGALPEHCIDVDADYGIVVVDETPCVREDGVTRQLGCVVHSAHAIYLDAELDESERVSVAVHEWLHVLSLCALGTGDPRHEDPRVWSRAGDDSAEELAVSSAHVDACL